MTKDHTDPLEAADRDAQVQTRDVGVRLDQPRSMGVDWHPGRDECKGKLWEIVYGHG